MKNGSIVHDNVYGGNSSRSKTWLKDLREKMSQFVVGKQIRRAIKLNVRWRGIPKNGCCYWHRMTSVNLSYLFSPHHLHAMSRCSLLLQMSLIAWSVYDK